MNKMGHLICETNQNENFNGSFCILYPNFPKTFFIHKMSKKESRCLKRAPFKQPKCKFSNFTQIY